jgi:signal transduction histidine kinase/CheY-like chemotaxis protein
MSSPSPVAAPPTQRILKIRRDYNAWVANETLEDYALRFTPRAFRKWSSFRVANTALGAVSFLALEAIGGSMVLNHGFTNAVLAILVVGLVVFLTALPISVWAARSGLDMDLLSRGAGFGYIGSTITSLIYASFTFIFFALEAAIMALALELWFGLPLVAGYIVSAVVVIPLVAYGVTAISRLQVWTQPVWIVLLTVPYVAVLWRRPDVVSDFTSFGGRGLDGGGFSPFAFGAAASVAFSLIAQVGEQVDYLRFTPERTADNRKAWWAAVLAAGPGWIVPGMAKMLGGALLAYLAVRDGVPIDRAVEPTQMYLSAFRYAFDNVDVAIAVTALFVLVSQIKINVTNAYAGSLAWSNFFSRLTHSHPGRVVWLVFNVAIATGLMLLGVFDALEAVLGFYSLVAVAWVGALVADLVINKPLGWSPKSIEFKRAYLYDVNPVGVGAMVIASALGIAAYADLLGAWARAFAPFIALGTAFVVAPVIAWGTRGRWYLARSPTEHMEWRERPCSVCGNVFEREDMAFCPAYGDAICSLCCSLEARCLDRCKPKARLSEQVLALLRAVLPSPLGMRLETRLGRYAIVMSALALPIGGVLFFLWRHHAALTAVGDAPGAFYLQVFTALMFVAAIGAWWVVLATESFRFAQEESRRQTELLMQEIEAHRRTDRLLQEAKETAEAASLAKSRFVTGMSHELRTPLNSVLGYAQLLGKDDALPPHRREAVAIIRRSGEHLLSLIDGLLDIARIEAGKLKLDRGQVHLPQVVDEIARMFRPQAEARGLHFRLVIEGRMPAAVYGDEKRLRQIVINLLGNAIKFTTSGHVGLRLRYQREIALIEVEDTGVGIPPEDLDRIFQPFERAARLRSTEIGTGLGLTITKLLVELMGGEIRVKSQPGTGSTFTARVYLPEVLEREVALDPKREVVGYHGARRKLLVVDDQSSHRQLLAGMLARIEFKVTQVSGGDEALQAALGEMPDLILLDISMPEMDGWTVSRRLREVGVEHARIVMVSANAFENVPTKLTEHGCDGFLSKPVMEVELLAMLRAQLGVEWRYRDEEPVETVFPAPRYPLPPPIARELLSWMTVGYVKGVTRKLEELERSRDELRPVTREFRELLREFRLDEVRRRLETMADG